jgi:hypothetical protein
LINSFASWSRADIYTYKARFIATPFQAKVDSYFPSGNRPPDAQSSRQLEYSAALDGDTKTLLLLRPHFNLTWYQERLSWAWNALGSRDRVFACLATWEEVFALNASSPGRWI